MTGVVGGERTGSGLSSLVDGMHREPWYEHTTLEAADAGLTLVEHGDEPASNWTWQGDRYLAVVYGTVSNLGDLPWSTEEAVAKLFEDADSVLPRLEGPFLLAAYDTETGTFRVATDKVDSRSCFYTTAGGGFHFGSEVSALLPAVDDPTLDRQAVSDLLLMGTVVGRSTLVEEVSHLPPATVVTYADGDLDLRRYWRPERRASGAADGDADPYVAGWIRKHQRAVGRLAGTIESDLGVWLSGGIDSRVMAEALRREGQQFDTLTYRTGDAADETVAQRVADSLGVRNYQIRDGSATDFRDAVGKCVEINDAMQTWSSVVTLPFMVSDLPQFADVVVEGSTFLGEDVWAHSLREREHPAEILYGKKRKLNAERVAEVVTGVEDPRRSLREEVAGADTDGMPYRLRALDAVRRFYAYTHMRSNAVQRSQVDTRVVSDGPLLEHVMNMPDEHRMNAVPLTDGAIPYGTPRIKLAVMRELSPELASIPYQRTGVPPAKPFGLHVAGFAAREVSKRVGSPPPRPYLDRYRGDPTVSAFLNSLLDDAADRPFLDADAVRRLQQEVWSGDRDDITPVAALTGVEYWVQRHLD